MGEMHNFLDNLLIDTKKETVNKESLPDTI